MNDFKELGLNNEILNSIISVICKNEKITKIILFGSRAKGNYKKGSDIDLAVFAENLSLSELMKIKSDLWELPLPYTFDIVDFSKIKNEDLRDHILRVGKVLYARS